MNVKQTDREVEGTVFLLVFDEMVLTKIKFLPPLNKMFQKYSIETDFTHLIA